MRFYACSCGIALLCPDEIIYQACRRCRLVPYLRPGLGLLRAVDMAKQVAAIIRKERGQ